MMLVVLVLVGLTTIECGLQHERNKIGTTNSITHASCGRRLWKKFSVCNISGLDHALEEGGGVQGEGGSLLLWLSAVLIHPLTPGPACAMAFGAAG